MRNPSELYRTMARIRRFEELTAEHLQQGVIPGAVHLSIGQEGVSAGVGCALQPGDRSSTTHRGHGDIVAVGGDIERMFAELLGRATGLCAGKGGSMHIADPSIGSLGANGLVGGGIPIAVGSALTSKLLDQRVVTVAFFGDGAVNAGSFHESINLATIWRLPIVFVCENNIYGQFTRTETLMAAKSLVDRAAAYGIPAVGVDGSDVVAVHEAACAFVEAARAGNGPQFIDGQCFRVRGHTEGDEVFLGGKKYRSDEEVDGYRARDPLRVIIDKGHLEAAAAAAIMAEVDTEIRAAFARALEAPRPDPEDALVLTMRGADS